MQILFKLNLTQNILEQVYKSLISHQLVTFQKLAASHHQLKIRTLLKPQANKTQKPKNPSREQCLATCLSLHRCPFLANDDDCFEQLTHLSWNSLQRRGQPSQMQLLWFRRLMGNQTACICLNLRDGLPDVR